MVMFLMMTEAGVYWLYLLYVMSVEGTQPVLPRGVLFLLMVVVWLRNYSHWANKVLSFYYGNPSEGGK